MKRGSAKNGSDYPGFCNELESAVICLTYAAWSPGNVLLRHPLTPVGARSLDHGTLE
jgi:hypothetical protein